MDGASSKKGKKLINSVDTSVDDCISGLVSTNPGLQQLEGHRVIVRGDIQSVIQSGKVSVLCGGGSGHEPAHAGYIGQGMLSAAVAGAVFTSPPPGSILSAIKAIGLNNAGGVLVVVKNYTGDRLNFGLAVERAKGQGLKVDLVVVGEDCALTSVDQTAGRRGLCGTVLVHKIAGALAEKGLPLEEIVRTVKDVTTKMGTIGLSLTPCSVPGSEPSFQLAEDEMELGLGIHGEAGVRRMKLQSAKEAVKTALDHMTNPQTTTHLQLNKGGSVALMVNNLGGTSYLELNIVANEAIQYLEGMGVNVDRAYCGTFMTAMEMAGISLTVLKLDATLKSCLDAPTTAPAWQRPLLAKDKSDRVTPPQMKVQAEKQQSVHEDATNDPAHSKVDPGMMRQVLEAVGQALESSEQRLNSLDRQSGDGDCGTTMARGARALLKELGEGSSSVDPGLPLTSPYRCALALAAIAENIMGGSSGALYSLFLTAASRQLQTGVTATHWASAMQAGVEAIMRYGGAKPGQRTMLDPLHAACVELEKPIMKTDPAHAFSAAVKAAEAAADATTKMAAQAGRASYVSAQHLTQPDPGAVAVATWMKAVLEKLR